MGYIVGFYIICFLVIIYDKIKKKQEKEEAISKFQKSGLTSAEIKAFAKILDMMPPNAKRDFSSLSTDAQINFIKSFIRRLSPETPINIPSSSNTEQCVVSAPTDTSDNCNMEETMNSSQIISEALNNACNKAHNLLSSLSVNTDIDTEITCFFVSLGGLSYELAGKDVQEYEAAVDDFLEIKFMSRYEYNALSYRDVLYNKIANGEKFRGEWYNGFIPAEYQSLAVNRMIMAFGDFLINEECAIDYYSAPKLDNNKIIPRLQTILTTTFKSVVNEFLFSLSNLRSSDITLNNPVCFCSKCGRQIDSTSQFCGFCGKNQNIQPLNVKETGKKVESAFSNYPILGIIVGLVIVIGLTIGFSQANGDGKSKPTPTPTAVVSTPKPTVRVVPAQVMPANGTMFKNPTYVKLCPFSVSVRGSLGYYVYLEYLYPSESYNSRHLEGKPQDPVEDIAFFVRPGCTVEMDVPVGVYKLYYATGEEWFGKNKLFGEDTVYNTSYELLEFYTDYTSANGVSLELWAQTGGNFDTVEIDEATFPG